MSEASSNSPETQPSYAQWQAFSWALTRSRMQTYAEWRTALIDDDIAGEQSAKEKFFIERCGLLTGFAGGYITEPEVLFVEPAHLFNDAEVAQRLGKLVPELSAAEATNMGLSLLDISLVEQYPAIAPLAVAGFSKLSGLSQMAGSSNGRKVVLFDPFYGIGLIKTDKWKTLNLASWLYWSRFEKISEEKRTAYLKNEMRSLTEGADLCMLLFGPLLREADRVSLKTFHVPELVFDSGATLLDFFGALKKRLADSRSGYQLWLRGQPSDYLMPDRSPLYDRRIAGYCSVRDSSLVPSLYRSVDRYQRDPDEFTKLVRHLGDWATWADISMPPMVTILDAEGKGPYKPKPLPAQAQTSFATFMSGQPHHHLPGLQDLGPYHLWRVHDADGNLVDQYIKLFHPSLQGHNETLLLQHYGCPTSWLDITKDPETALWFALNKMNVIRTGEFQPHRFEWTSMDPANWPTIYVFALHPAGHPFIDSSIILQGTKFLRPQVQKCGLLFGGGNLCRNYAARFVAMKIRLGPGFSKYSTLPASILFPDERDEGLHKLLTLQDQPMNDKLFPVYRVSIGE